MASVCRKKNKSQYANTVTNAIYQFFKCLLILSVLFVLVLVRRSLKSDFGIGIAVMYVIFACIGLVLLYLVDGYIYNNIFIGIGIYLGFELLKTY